MRILSTERVNEEDLDLLRHKVKFNWLRNLEIPSLIADYTYIRLDQGRTVDDMIEGFEKVTTEDVLDVAQKYLPKDLNGKPNYVLLVRDPLKRE